MGVRASEWCLRGVVVVAVAVKSALELEEADAVAEGRLRSSVQALQFAADAEDVVE